MHEAVLLFYAVPVRNMDFGSSVFDDRQMRMNQAHGVLLVKTGGDTCRDLGIGDACHGASHAQVMTLGASRPV